MPTTNQGEGDDEAADQGQPDYDRPLGQRSVSRPAAVVTAAVPATGGATVPIATALAAAAADNGL